eukprot:6290108-Prymnesium_polylepis.1
MGTSTSVWQPTDDYMIQFARMLPFSAQYRLANSDLPPNPPCSHACCCVVCTPGTRPPLSRPETDAGLVVWWDEG